MEPDSVQIRIDPAAYDVVHAQHGPEPAAWQAAFRYGATTTWIVPTGVRVANESARAADWRLLSIEADLPFDAVGFFAPLADALAEEGIPILPFASYKYDHVLVPASKADRAAACLRARAVDAYAGIMRANRKQATGGI